MFEKPIKPLQKTQLKKNEIRKFKANLKTLFSWLSEQEIKSLIPTDNLSVVKVISGNVNPNPNSNSSDFSTHPSKVSVWFHDTTPIFFDAGDRQDQFLVPTVYGLWRVPNLLGTFTIFGGVFNYILKGADLMFPGVVENLDEMGAFGVGECRSVCPVGSRAAVAVGLTETNSDKLHKSGKNGKALKILHFYRDYLWELGPKSHPPHIDIQDSQVQSPQDSSETGQSTQTIQTTQTPTQEKIPDSTTTTPTSEDEKQDEENPDEPKPDEEKPDEEGEEDSEEGSNSQQKLKKMDKKKKKKNQSNSSEANQLQPGHQEEMDQKLKMLFLYIVKSAIREQNFELPVLLSTLYANMLSFASSSSISLDIKKSSFKKVGNFFRSLEKAGLITIHEASAGVLELVGLNRENPIYRNFSLENGLKDIVPDQNLPSTTPSPDSTSEAKGIHVVELYQPTKPILHAFFPSEDENSSFQIKQLHEALWKYVSQNELSEPGSPQVKLDKVLAETVCGKKTLEGTQLPKKELVQKFTSKMKYCYQINFPDGTSTLKKGNIMNITIDVKRVGPKIQTRVFHLSSFGINPSLLTSVFKKHFAASSHVSTMVATGGEQEVLFVQGQFPDKIASYLIDEVGIPKRFIEVIGPKSK